MTKTALVEAFAKEVNASNRAAHEAVEAILDTIMEGVKKEGEVRITGFGTFKKSKRAARTGVNPQNPKEKIKISAMNVVTFKAGSEFKACIK